MTIKLKQEGSINFIQSGNTTATNSIADLRFTNLNSGSSGTTLMTLTTAGNIGIITTAPSGKLDINSDFIIADSIKTLPDIALSSNTSDSKFTFSASSMSSDAYKGFKDTNFAWFSIPAVYSSGQYTGGSSTIINGSSVAGEWIQVYIPNGISKITSTSHISPNSNVAAFTFCASVDGSSFTSLVQDETMFEGTFNVPAEKVTNQKYYYLRWVMRSLLEGLYLEAYVSDILFTGSYGVDVGIGTTSPVQKLDIVGGSLRITGGSLIATHNSNTIGNLFTTAGNIGIGTTSPVQKLEVGGAIRISTAPSISYDGDASIMFNQSGVGPTIQGYQFDVRTGSTTSSMRITNTGNVGIGTTSPIQKLDVNGTIRSLGGTNLGIELFHNGSKGTIVSYNRTSNSYNGLELGSSFIQMYTNDNLILNITGGNVGIANTTPLYTLDVNGTFDVSNSNGLILFNSAGNFGIGTTAPAYKLVVAGDIYATGDVMGFSDERLKTDIYTIPNALNKVESMRGVNYTMKSTGKRSVGVIAQEMQQVLPEVIAEKEEYLGVSYGNIVGVLIEAIKELSQKIKDLESKLQ
jgi:hypothetical protein